MTLIEALAKLAPDDSFIFTCFHEKKDREKIPRTFPASLEDCKEQLQALNQQGYGIYFGVNYFQGRERKKDKVKQFRAIWQDDDKGFQGEYPLAPSWVVCSSPGKYQRYWFIAADSAPSMEEWQRVQSNMVKWGADRNALDAARVLRVPGFMHLKGEPTEVVETDTNGAVYSWSELVEAFGPTETATETANKPSVHIQQALDDIKSGENYNGSLCTLAQHYANQGIPAQALELMLRGALNESVGPRDERWLARMEHVPIYARTACEKAREVVDPALDYSNVTLQEENAFQEVLPWPPGYLGAIARSAYRAQIYQNQTVAVVTALGVAAAVTGRKYNISKTGLNIYQTILMDSGRGKDSINQYVNWVLAKFNSEIHATHFIGSKRHTGPKALMDELKEKKCMLSVFTEAGYMFKSSAGDQAGLIRTILDLYTKSGKDSYATGEAYSSKDDSIQTLRAPALSVINEATPITLIEELNKRKSESTGELARMNLFRVYGQKPYENQDRDFILDSQVCDYFELILRKCLKSVVTDDPEAIDITLPQDYFKYSNHCTDMENSLLRANPIKAMMYSRAAIKCLKLAALCAVFDPSVDPDAPVVTPQAWEWAKEVIRIEMDGIDDLGLTKAVAAASFDLDELAESVVAPVIYKVLTGHFIDRKTGEPNAKLNMSPRLAAKGIVSYTVLSYHLRNNRQLLDLNDKRTTGLAKVLEHMCNMRNELDYYEDKVVTSTRQLSMKARKPYYKVRQTLLNQLSGE